MQFRALVDLFLRHHTQHHSAANTLIFYRTQLGQLAPHLTKPVERLGPADILLALDQANRGKSPTTQRHRAVAIDQLQKYAVTLDLIPKPWLAKVPKPTPSQRQRIPTEEETRALMARATSRFRLIYEALRLSGARPNELCRATIADWHRDANGQTGVIVLAEHKTARKSGKPRTIPIGRKLGKLLRLAIGRRTAGPIFLSPRNHGWTVKNLSTQFARLRDAGLDRELVLYSCGTRQARRFVASMGS